MHSRSIQRRLIWLIGGLGLCVLALQVLGRSHFTAFLLGVAERQTPSSNHVPLIPNVDDTGSSQVRVVSVSPSIEVPDDDLRVDAEFLNAIKDNSVGIRDSERDLYFQLLRRIRSASDRVAKRAAKSIAFQVLMTDSKEFLGCLLNIKGEVRRLTPIATPPDRGIDQLYEAWVFNSDSGTNPYRIVFSELPVGIPTGDKLQNGIAVQAVGYYFKRLGYPTADGRLHVAPLIVAKTLQWQQQARSKPPTSSALTQIVVLFLGLLVVALTAFWWRVRVGDRNFEERILKRLRGQTPLLEAPNEASTSPDNPAT